jgi:hypothetical protein
MKGQINIKSFGVGLLTCVSLLISYQSSNAAVYTISAPGAYLSGDGDSINDWVASGADFLNTELAFYRIGSAGGETLLAGGLFDPVTGYVNHQPIPGLTITYAMTLSSSSAATSLLNKTITINNATGNSVDLHFFVYSDFTLPGSPLETVTITAPTALGYGRVVQNFAGYGNVTETMSSRATKAQADSAAALLASLSDSSPTTLSGNLTATGDAAWAFQWDVVIANNSGKVLSTVYMVPEPTALALGGLGLVLMVIRNRKH